MPTWTSPHCPENHGYSPLDTGLRRIRYTPGSDLDFLDWRQGSGNTVEILHIQVDSRRRQGIGRWLINQLLDHADLPEGTRLVWAVTRADNLIAQLFYEELRFRVVGVLRNFYGTRTERGTECVDAVMYGRDVGSQA